MLTLSITVCVHRGCTSFTLSVQNLYIHARTPVHCCVYTHILERCITETEPVTTHWEPLAGCPALINTESEAVWGRVTSALVSWPSTQFTYNFSYSWGIRRRRKRSHNSKPDTEIWTRLRDNPPTRQAATEAGGPLHLSGSDRTGSAPPYRWDTDPQTDTARLFVSPDNGGLSRTAPVSGWSPSLSALRRLRTWDRKAQMVHLYR